MTLSKNNAERKWYCSVLCFNVSLKEPLAPSCQELHSEETYPSNYMFRLHCRERYVWCYKAVFIVIAQSFKFSVCSLKIWFEEWGAKMICDITSSLEASQRSACGNIPKSYSASVSITCSLGFRIVPHMSTSCIVDTKLPLLFLSFLLFFCCLFFLTIIWSLVLL